MWADECDEVILAQLAESYIARRNWEAELQAGFIIHCLGMAMGGETPAASAERIPASDMLALIGGFN